MDVSAQYPESIKPGQMLMEARKENDYFCESLLDIDFY